MTPMKYIAAIAILFLIVLATSCGSVSVVSNRDSTGKYINPICPKCGLAFSDSATVYRDTNDHYGVSAWVSGSSAPPTLAKRPW